MSLGAFLAKILYVGHSLVGPDLPPLVQAVLTAMDRPAVIEAQVINGAPLRVNWTDTGQGVPARARLAEGVDLLVLTEAVPLSAHVQWNDTPGYVTQWAQAARAGNPQAQVWLYEVWPRIDSGPGLILPDEPEASLPWSDRIDLDSGRLRQVADTAGAAAGVRIGIIPAGQAMRALGQAAEAGEVPGIDTLGDVFADEIHPNAKGLYFLALVHAAALTGQSPEGLPAQITRSWPSRDAVITDAQAAALQRIAWVTVRNAQTATAMAPSTGPPHPEKPGEPPAGRSATLTADPADASLPIAPLQPEQPGESLLTADPSDASLPNAPLQPETAGNQPTGAPAVLTAVLTADPPADPQRLTGITNPNLALGLNGISDWSVQLPFLDLMKSSRPWTGHLPGQFGGWDHDRLEAAGWLDDNGWPVAMPPALTGISALMLTDLPQGTGGVAGTYLVRWQGRGEVVVEGRATDIVQGDGRAQFAYTPGPGYVAVTIRTTDPADPVRNLTVVRQDRAAALDAGEVFNPDWLARLRGVRMVRFMDWMATNDSTLARAADRPLPQHSTWGRRGVPMEVMVALANRLQADAWFTVPHLAEDALVADMAQVATGLAPGLRAWVEYSNEVWNWQFAQAAHAEDQGRARWGREATWVQFYALRATQVAGIWAQVFDDPDRLVRVIAAQTGWLGLEEQILMAPEVMAEGLPAPAAAFDAYAVAGYFSAHLGGEEKRALVTGWLDEPGALDRAAQELRDGSLSGDPEDSLRHLLDTVLTHHRDVAARHGLQLVMYEGGSHVVGYGAAVDDPALTEFFHDLSYSPQMGALYGELLAGWAQLTDAPFNAFVDVAAPSKWGSWGALRHLADDNPRWQALANP